MIVNVAVRVWRSECGWARGDYCILLTAQHGTVRVDLSSHLITSIVGRRPELTERPLVAIVRFIFLALFYPLLSRAYFTNIE